MIFALEGCDFCGKSTLARHFVEAHGYTSTFDPGGTPLSQSLRQLLLHRMDLNLTERELTLLFAAGTSSVLDHAKTLEARGCNVVIDRTHVSTYAYRMAGGVPMAHLRALTSLFLPHALPAARVFYLYVPYEVRRARAAQVPGSGKDRFESRSAEWMGRVEAGYGTLANLGLCTRIDGDRPTEAVAADILARI